MPTTKNIPGIIPVANQTSEFGMEWESSLIPVAPDYTAIEASIFECAQLGCSSIWIVANDDTAPLLKHRVGDSVVDIESVKLGRYIKFPNNNYVDIPIYYVPVHPRHKGKYDNYSWSIVWGAHVAYSIMKKFSRWTIPVKYYVSFPLGIFDHTEVYERRTIIKNNTPSYFSYKGKTIRDGYPISFSFSFNEWKIARDKIIKNANAMIYSEEAEAEGKYFPYVRAPVEERRKSLKYSLKDVFSEFPEGREVDVRNYFDLTSWGEYARLLNSDVGRSLYRPSDKVMYKREQKR